MKKSLILYASIILAILALAGCAEFPDGGQSRSGTQLVITMTVAGQINPDYYYYVAIDNDGDPSTGPVAVAGPPWGNGWGGNFITSYVLYHRTEPQGYSVYQIQPNTDLLVSTRVGQPVNITPVPPNGNTIRFTVDLSQIQTAAIPADQIQSLDINFINVTEPVLDPNFNGPRPFDGLGDLGGSYVNIITTTPRTYTNATSSVNEVAGDVIDPDLDIIDWSVEVQRF